MAISMSISKGKGNIKHNNRTQPKAPKNVDMNRSEMNVYLIQDDIREVYKKLFQASVDNYNQTQKRADRKIKDYYSHINHSKKHNTFHELVVQIGNKDEQVDPMISKRILIDFVEQFQKQNPQLRVFGAYVHMDESTPHLHLDYVPFAMYSRGQGVRVANDQAIKQMGFKSWNDWKDKQFDTLESIAKEYNVERYVMNNTDKHIASVSQFKALKKAEEQLIQREEAVEKAELQYQAFIKNAPNDVKTVIKQQKEQIDELIQKNKKLHSQVYLLLNLLAQMHRVVNNLAEKIQDWSVTKYINNAITNLVERIVNNFEPKELDIYRHVLNQNEKVSKKHNISL